MRRPKLNKTQYLKIWTVATTKNVWKRFMCRYHSASKCARFGLGWLVYSFQTPQMALSCVRAFSNHYFVEANGGPVIWPPCTTKTWVDRERVPAWVHLPSVKERTCSSCSGRLCPWNELRPHSISSYLSTPLQFVAYYDLSTVPHKGERGRGGNNTHGRRKKQTHLRMHFETLKPTYSANSSVSRAYGDRHCVDDAFVYLYIIYIYLYLFIYLNHFFFHIDTDTYMYIYRNNLCP